MRYNDEHINANLRDWIVLIVVVQQLYAILIILDDNLCRSVKVQQLTSKTYLRNVDVGLLGSHQVELVTPLPLDQKVQFPGLLRGSEDLLRLQSSGKSSRLIVSPFRLLSWRMNNWLSITNNQSPQNVDKPLGPVIEIPRSSMILLDLPRRMDLGLLLAPSVMSAEFYEPAVCKDAHRHLSSPHTCLL